jgi:hypothetical protein
MKKVLLLTLLTITLSTFSSFAQVEGEPTPISFGETGNKTYVDLISELFMQIQPQFIGGGWDQANRDWNADPQNKNTIKQQAARLKMIAFHLTSNAFKPEWNSISKDWNKKLLDCQSKSQLAICLKQFESMLNEGTFTKAWKAERNIWVQNVESKIEPTK